MLLIRTTLQFLLLFVAFNANAQVIREVHLSLVDGKISILELGRAMLDEYGYDGDALKFSDVRIDLSGKSGASLLRVAEQVLFETANFTLVPEEEKLRIRIDHVRARSVQHLLKKRLGSILGLIAGRDILKRSYALNVPTTLGAEERFVVFVHGIDSSEKVFSDLSRFLAKEPLKLTTGSFVYANDEAVDRIAKELASKLKQRHIRFPKQRIVIVAHSMGGLIARYMLETPGLDPGNVEQLIMIGTPNHGSRLSRFRSGLDALQFLRDYGADTKLLSLFLDGMGEAGWDLWPDSPFLTELNARPRNPKVTYRLLLGSQGLLPQAEMAVWRKTIMDKVRTLKGSQLYAPKVETWLEDLDEIVDGRGDGAVSIRRGKLNGVQEVIVPMTHTGMLTAYSAGQAVFAKIGEWLR